MTRDFAKDVNSTKMGECVLEVNMENVIAQQVEMLSVIARPSGRVILANTSCLKYINFNFDIYFWSYIIYLSYIIHENMSFSIKKWII